MQKGALTPKRVTANSIAKLIVGKGVNTVHFMPGGSIAGNLDGSAAKELILDYRDASADKFGSPTVNLNSIQTSGVLGNLSGFTTVIGSRFKDVLTGSDDVKEILDGSGGDDLLAAGADW